MAGRFRRAFSWLKRRGKERRIGEADRRQTPFEAEGYIWPAEDAGSKKRRSVNPEIVRGKAMTGFTEGDPGLKKLVYNISTDRREPVKKKK